MRNLKNLRSDKYDDLPSAERVGRPARGAKIRVGERRPDLAQRAGKPRLSQHRVGAEVVR